MPALERLFELYDERRRAQASYRKNRLVEGSKGQPVRNPLGRVIAECERSIGALEDRFGLTPKSRLQLGLTAGAGPQTIDELNRSLNQDQDDRDDGDEDPRLQTA